jgi:predicted permease
MLTDLRFAFRVFARQRAFFITAVLTIALGIGLSATVFAVVDGVLFRPLPFRDPGRLVAIFGAVRAEQQTSMPVSWPDLVDWRAGSRALQQIEGYSLGTPQARVKGAGETIQVASAPVTAGFFDMLGVSAILGRTLIADDFTTGATPVAVISYVLWKSAFGSDPDVLGRAIVRSGETFTIVGVLPRSFVFPAPHRRVLPEVFVPMIPHAPTDRTSRVFTLIGRLADGASVRHAQTELDGIALRLKPLFVGRPNTFPGAFDGATVLELRPHLTRLTRPILWMVFGAVSAVFAIACVNLVALLLAHGEDRRREMGVRAALGAGRGALMRQLLTEAAVLALSGAVVGWLLCVVWFGALLSQLPKWMQFLGEPRLDVRVAAFAGFMTLLTLLFAGVIPALRAAKAAPGARLADGNRQVSGGNRGRHALVMVEVTLATVLLLAGSIMLRGWLTLYSQDTGIDADRVIAVRAVPAPPVDPARSSAFNAAVGEALRRVPGVESVDLTDMPLLQRAMKGSRFVPPARVPHPAGPDTDVMVTPGYFTTMGITVKYGRGLRPDDRGRAVVISEALATRYWPGQNPVGRFITYQPGTREIVGVVTSARDVSLDIAPMPTLYHVWDDERPPVATFVIRFAGSSAAVLPQLRRGVRGVDEGAVITMLATVEELLSTSVAERNFNTLLFAVFAGAGLIVALVGIYGLVAFIVARREREMGIRLALGASRRRLKIFVVSTTVRWVAAGIGCGLVVGLLFAKSLKPFVYQVAPNDPATLLVAACSFLLVAVVASYIPARRAARVDPMVALRAE